MQVLTPCAAIPTLLLPSSERISTPAAYAALDEAFGGFAVPGAHGDLPAMLAALSARDAKATVGALYNVFEDVILPTCPEATENRRRLLSLGATATLMSGSGATMLGFFETAEAAEAAALALGDRAVSTVTL